jgi:hypothetical protein
MILVKNNNCSIVADTSAPAESGTGHIFYSSDLGTLQYQTIPNPDLMSPIPPRQFLLNPWTYWGNDVKLASIRLQRNYLLYKSDWVVSKYAETLTEVPQNWRDYRQQLRDFPSTVDVNLPIEQIVWPVSP